MNKLDAKTRSLILRHLIEGNSIRATGRIADVSKNTVNKLLVDAGRVCAAYHDQAVGRVEATHVQADVIWAFCYAKAKNVEKVKGALEEVGDIWTWTALDRDSKLILSYTVGDRSPRTARELMFDLTSRVAGRIQLTTGSHGAYLKAVADAFGGDIDCAVLVKQYGDPTTAKGQERKYSPAECSSVVKEPILGSPGMGAVSMPHVECQILAMGMGMRRFARLSNAFSKKAENHAYAVALHFLHYNFCRVHESLSITPAMAAGVAERHWDVDDIVALVDATVPVPKRRGPYKKRQLKSSS